MATRTYNKKVFLHPNSIRTMAAVHAKVKGSGECSIRISDCNRTVKIWVADINKAEDKEEMLVKLYNLRNEISLLEMHIRTL